MQQGEGTSHHLHARQGVFCPLLRRWLLRRWVGHAAWVQARQGGSTAPHPTPIHLQVTWNEGVVSPKREHLSHEDELGGGHQQHQASQGLLAAHRHGGESRKRSGGECCNAMLSQCIPSTTISRRQSGNSSFLGMHHDVQRCPARQTPPVPRQGPALRLGSAGRNPGPSGDLSGDIMIPSAAARVTFTFMLQWQPGSLRNLPQPHVPHGAVGPLHVPGEDSVAE
jgi:hypothetical protein